MPDLSLNYPEDLPVSQHVEQIKTLLQIHQVLVVAGETGSGKTTQLPKICLELGRGTGGLIGHTQPRRIAAQAVARRLAEELKNPSAVSFQVRFSDTTTPDTRVKVMTDGILLSETRGDPLFKRYDTIIIDEAHERTQNIDVLLGYINRVLPKRPDLKLIITSATIDVEKFSAHFDHAPILQISGRTYPVKILYRPALDYAEITKIQAQNIELGEQVLLAYQEILQLEKHKKPQHLDVLVFLSGEREIREVAEVLRKAELRGVEILPLYARLSASEQQRIFAGYTSRRIVLSTNVAETSLTVPGIGYVIDSGLARISRYSVRSKIQRLPIEPISQASANQRSGRCGRLSPGVCIRLYSEEDFLNRPEFTDTEIMRTNLAAVILQMLSLRLGKVEKFPFLDQPDPRAVRDGFRLLDELNAVDFDGHLTETGKLLASLPLDPRLGRVLIEAIKQGCLDEALIIVSALTCQDPRERPIDKQQSADEIHRKLFHPDSDFCTWLNLWQTFEVHRKELSSSQLRRYCQKHYLSWMRMREWREIHRQLLIHMQSLGFERNKQPADYANLHKALLSGFLSQIAQRTQDGSYLGTRNRELHIFPGSTLHRKVMPWILVGELMETSQLYARMNAKIEIEWIETQAVKLLKHAYYAPTWHRRQGRVIGQERITLFGLVLVESRPVNFGKLDPQAARAIFVQEGLVPHRVDSKAPFVAANRRLIKEYDALEERTRRRDLLVDDSVIAAYYEARLPMHVIDVPSLERWYRKLSPREQKKLYLTEEDLVTHRLADIDPYQFPKQIAVSALELQLDYVFDPSKQDDGVSLKVPVTALKQLRLEELDWLVPGLLTEKCTALIKALPKHLRKNFVPVPDIVSKVVPELKREDGSLRQSLARQLLRLTLVQLPVDVWDEVILPTHLNMNIIVIDEDGKPLAQGRDLQVLKEHLSEKVQASITRLGQETLEREGIKDWDFGELVEEVNLRFDGLEIKAYPALVDRGDSVALSLMDSPYKAQLSSVWGMARLFMLKSKDQRRYLEKHLLQNPRQISAISQIGQRSELLDSLCLRAYIITYELEASLPRTQEEFIAKLQKRAEVIATADKLETLVFQALEKKRELTARLERGFKSLQDMRFRQDVERQLEGLISSDFLLQTPWDALQQYPRYLQAIALRMDKCGLSKKRDEENMRELERLSERYHERYVQLKKMEQVDAHLDQYRWLLEELRVSLFAQNLGTRVPVSVKRLDKFWADLVK